MTPAKPVRSLEEMAREACGCEGWAAPCKCEKIAAFARAYANQKLREAAQALESQGHAVADKIDRMIEGEPPKRCSP